jgi:hypothetical protein
MPDSPVGRPGSELLEPAIAEFIARYGSKGASDAALGFARGAVGEAMPRSVHRARALLWTSVRMASWGEDLGLELVPEVLFHPSVIERYLAVGIATESPTLRRTARANLRYLARASRRDLARWPDPTLIRRDHPKPPYAQAEIDGYFSLAAHQPTESRRRRLVALLCLGLGAGLDGVDLRHVRGHHVIERSGGVVVEVTGPRARTVPVLGRYQDRLLRSAGCAGERFICGGEAHNRKNVTANLVGKLAGGEDLVRLEVSRLRATWLAEVAARFHIPVLLEVTGLKTSSRLGVLTADDLPTDEVDVVTLFGAKR